MRMPAQVGRNYASSEMLVRAATRQLATWIRRAPARARGFNWFDGFGSARQMLVLRA